MSLAKRMLVDFLNSCDCLSVIEVGDNDRRFTTDGSTGVVGTIVELAPLLECDR
jgi:hypothetical protein